MENNSIWVKTNDNNIEYTWEISIGKYGGFIYRNISNQERKYEYINQNDISEIDECEKDLEYLNINECIGVHSTSVDLPNIKAGSKFGWDYKNKAWTYFINGKEYPSYYSIKI
jgi:hypothetical protein